MELKIKTFDTEGNTLIISVKKSPYFAITCSAYEKGQVQVDRNFIYGGCNHKEILEVRPDLKPFVDLHLSDSNGEPMHLIDNGFYWVKTGFHPTLKEHLRCSDELLPKFTQCTNKSDFARALIENGMFEQYAKEAESASLLFDSLLK